MRPDGVARTGLPVTGVRLSLWRAAAVYRAATLVVCVYLVVRWRDLYAHTAVAALAAAGMVLVTTAVCWLAVRGRAHRIVVVGADVAATAGLTIASIGAQTPHQRHGDMPTLTTLWAAGPALEAGIVLGAIGGLLAGTVQIAAAVIVRNGYDGRTLSSGVLIMVAGGVVGFVTRLTVRAEDDLRAATAERAAAAERIRMARSIHDGVLQVLGLVARDPDGPLAAEAARQEVALRALLNSAPAVSAGDADLVAVLRERATERVQVSSTVPSLALPERWVTELHAAVGAALDNVAQHAGAEAHAWVLLDVADDGLTLTVRDDGVGFAPERLDRAAAEGRLGVASSIRGRIAELGGRVEISAAPSRGTIVQLHVPVGEP